MMNDMERAILSTLLREQVLERQRYIVSILSISFFGTGDGQLLFARIQALVERNSLATPDRVKMLFCKGLGEELLEILDNQMDEKMEQLCEVNTSHL